mmetsp:Transcript_15816/g.22611  ORF Transcript_15816/g.22611 Transcript_15816/m.22611 type:complete len:256 (+) Transcript_15816:58-825(+)
MMVSAPASIVGFGVALFLVPVHQCSALAFTRPTQIYSILSQLTTTAVTNECSTTNSALAATDKWDQIILEDEDEIIQPPKDMEYTPQNILRQHNNYLAITDVGGNETVTDVYARDPDKNTFWFVGKIARCTGTKSIEQAISRQWFLIESHAARLRHKELAPKMKIMELWVAPGNSELDVAFNRNVLFTKMNRPTKQAEIDHIQRSIKAIEVAFQGEIYDQGEEGFRTERTNDGLPAHPERTGFQQPQTDITTATP